MDGLTLIIVDEISRHLGYVRMQKLGVVHLGLQLVGQQV